VTLAVLHPLQAPPGSLHVTPAPYNQRPLIPVLVSSIATGCAVGTCATSIHVHEVVQVRCQLEAVFKHRESLILAMCILTHCIAAQTPFSDPKNLLMNHACEDGTSAPAQSYCFWEEVSDLYSKTTHNGTSRGTIVSRLTV
jgi:hypothetical protein